MTNDVLKHSRGQQVDGIAEGAFELGAEMPSRI